MFGGRYFGLEGTKLNIAIGVIAGIDFLLFGYDQGCSAFSLGHFIAGRIITGIGNGLNTSTVPTWQSETSKSHRRGQMVMVEGALITGGVCLSYWVDFGFSFLEPSTISWRFPIAFQIFFALIILAFILELPESPRWLILKGKEDEALTVLGALSAKSTDDPYVHSEFVAIKDTVFEMAAGGFRDLFARNKDRHLHRTILAYINQVFQQISGINLITYYAAYIYENEIGLTPFISRILAAANAGQSFSMVMLAIMTYLGGTGPGIVAAAFLFLFNTFFAIGWLGMTWLYPAEIVPLRIRAPANGLSTSANWAFNFMVVMITPVAFQNIGYQTYIIFAVINAFICPVVYFFYPETAYRSLEELDTIFHKSNTFTVVKVAKNEPRRYGKNGELLIDYEATPEHAQFEERRRSSVASGMLPHGKSASQRTENVNHANLDSRAEKGYADISGNGR
ncbi:hypothetical protein H2199_004116 [Coniosporium tulheliwenetii]|uniref:Uncharacterized protein n=1 Tax=Coniosporium tulheliwenetii TaxID=3383036 RepID=A0ACC2Z6Q2_9PEZI|nr:hypothetical protein H2199_004116 [Cladosporium sp. JES 115]